MIEIRDLVVGYEGKTVVDGFTATIKKGSITTIIGRNGAGKSTLLSAIAGDIEISSGEIEINSRSIKDYSLTDISQTLSLAQQSHSYWMSYSVKEIIWLGHDAVSKERFDYLSRELQLGEFLRQPITALSGGQLQRVEIARSLMREVPLVLLDEPFASQDLVSVERITRLIQNERDSGGTFVIVTHSREEDLQWCDQIINLGL
jgi:ABC-type cobalamin/Fe3+-siderophores transport system ATPase subunit